jgi:YYY domain-containing protein
MPYHVKPKAKTKSHKTSRPAGLKTKTKKSQHRPASAASRGSMTWWGALTERLRAQPELFWLGVVVLCGLLLRMLHPDWYWNRQFHPDERWIFGVVSQLSYPDAPTALQYGTFPLYLLSSVKDLAVFMVSFFGHLDANQFVIGAGRTLSALFDTGTLIFTYLLGARMFSGAAGRRLGLLAAGFLAFSVLNIQMAHFFVVDVPLGFLVVATLYGAVGIAQEGRRRDYLFAGVCLGLAMATKTSGLPVSLAVGAAHLIGLGQAEAQDRPRRWLDLALAVVASGVAFFIAMPHAILDWSRFWINQNEQRRILVTGEADVPYNRQYLHTTPYLYYGKNLIKYTLGWPLGLLSLTAFLVYPLQGLWVLAQGALARKWKTAWQGVQKNAVLIIVLTFGVAYALVIGPSFAKFNRYCLPLTPVLALAAAHLLFNLWERVRRNWARRLVVAAGALVAAATVFWALAFVSIYSAEHPWVAASRWLLQHAPDYATGPGGFLRPTAILNEEWGDDLPVYVEGVPAKAYRINKFSVQESDTPLKRANILAMLPANDWIAVADTRAHAVYRRLPERYPINAAYYELLFANQLGYHLAAEFKNYPRLFGREFPDDRADESFTLYDHPHVYLFQRDAAPLLPGEVERRLDAGIARVQQRIPAALPAVNAALPQTAFHPALPVPTALPTVVNKNIGQSQARPVFILGHLNSFTAGLAWLLLLEFIGLLAAPVCLYVFPRLPDSGLALAKIVGTLLFAWTVWALVSLGVLQHTQGASAVVLLGFAVAAAAWALRHPGELQALVKKQARNWAWSEVVFIAAFVGYMLTKLYNPDIHNPFGQGYNGGGEPMGMTFFSGVYKSLHFPPYDAWLSGYPINYYYYGHVILGILAKLIGVPPAWSYNITLSLLFALTVTGLYGLGYALTGRRSYGVLAAVAGAMLGNLQALFYLLEPFNRGTLFNDGLTGLLSWWQETWHHAGRFEFMWNPTRLIKGTINEMPWFSFLYGDLHAHIIAIPYSLPLIGWGLNVLAQAPRATDRFPEAAGDTPAQRGWSWFLAALTLGALSAINTWNFPPYALLVLMVLAARAYRNQAKPGWAWKPLGVAAFAWLRLVAGGLLLLFFFHRNFIPNSTSLAFVNPEVRTTLRDFMVFFALAIFAVSSFWAQEIFPALAAWGQKLAGKTRARDAWWQPWVNALKTLWRQYPALIYVGGTITLCVAVLMIFGQVLLTVLTIMLLLGAYVLITRPLDAPGLMAMLLAELGFCIVWGCEWVHVKDFMGVGGDMSRMNTVFKFYMVVWIFFALAVAAGLHRVLSQQAAVQAPKTRAARSRSRVKKVSLAAAGGGIWGAANRRQLWLGALGVLILWALANFFQVNTEWPWLTLLLFAGLLVLPWLYAAKPKMFLGAWTWVLLAIVFSVGLYPPISLYNRLHLCSEFKNPTLNGEAYLERLNPADAKALGWVNANITATEVVLEAPGPQGYNCFDTRVAIFTGQPTLIGWIGEEEQMRYNDALTSSRVADANRIFGGWDAAQARELMQKYRVGYVYVGANEKKMYPGTGLDKFKQFMDTVYDQDGVTIYKTRI